MKILAAAALTAAIFAAPGGIAHADSICPDGREGVTGPTTCAFARNVAAAYWASGGSEYITAFSPVTGERYRMTCISSHPVVCTGGDNAEVTVY
jgi:hypothetical protein